MSTEDIEVRNKARELYFQSALTQEKIGEMLGVSQKTVSVWVNEGKWRQVKSIHAQTPAYMIAQMNNELVEINRNIALREPGTRFATPAEAETRRKIMASIQIIKKSHHAGAYMDVLMNFISFVVKTNLKDGQMINGYAEQYMKIEMDLIDPAKYIPPPMPDIDYLPLIQ